VRVALLTVGDEILVGDIVNTNAAWLGERLTRAGLAVVASAVVGDDVARIAAALRAAVADADVVIVTGGLGPTPDDLTREALAAVAGVPLRRDPALQAALQARYAPVRRDVPEINWRQADLPGGAVPLPNPVGSAPGLRLQVGSAVAYAVPGVPREMEAMVAASVLPDLTAAAAGPRVVLRTLRTVGRWESDVATALAGVTAEGLAVAFLAGGGEVRVRFSATDPALVATAEEQARAALGEDVYGADDDTLPAVVSRLLAGRTVATAESLTGGLLATLLTETPGASATFRGGVVAYATDLKAALLGVPQPLLAERGPVDPDVAVAMARGARERLGTAYAVALTGVAGPDPQGTASPGTVYVAVAEPHAAQVFRRRLPGDRGAVRRLAAMAGLDALRRTLLREASQ
jgi:nicotinamide-nucleotide amidase